MDWRPANRWLPACAALHLAMCASAATTATWEMSNYQDFMHGRLSGVSLTRDGRLMLAPNVDTVFYSGQPEIWSVAAAADGTLYLGTGHRGRVYRIDSPKTLIVGTSTHRVVDASGVVHCAPKP